MWQRRYQHWGPNGLQWTEWYNCTFKPSNPEKDKWELKNKLKAEYREVSDSTNL